MYENYFKDCSLDDLYLNGNLTEPILPGKIDWTPVIIQATITAVIVVVPIITIVVIHNHQQNKKLEAIRKETEAKLQAYRSEQQLENEAAIERAFSSLKNVG